MSVARQEKKLMTAEELWEMPEVPGKRFELVDGELVELPGAGMLHGDFVGILYSLLRVFVLERGLGRVYGDGVAYIIQRDPDRVRIPDVSFISWNRLPEEDPVGFCPVAPDIAVEVVSPGDSASEVRRKVRQYLEAGTKAVWVLWPELRSVSVSTADGNTRELNPDDELDGGDVLPGFRVKVGELFDVPRRPA